eukprot:GHRQ01037298.1.p2 GENE.GHRQ01037298.1~~GHRQ01037298.1.p2  ORF type:complete len:102 (-),score=23.30 GHRQ01037298.1:159-464(-)
MLQQLCDAQGDDGLPVGTAVSCTEPGFHHPQVSTLTAAQLLNGSWTSEAALLVLPGGADMPYCNSLNGRGNTIITGAPHCTTRRIHSCLQPAVPVAAEQQQ